jgi:hypothetical protein
MGEPREEWGLSIDVAKVLGCSTDFVAHLVRTGQLDCEYSVGRKVKLFRMAEVHEFARQRAELARRKKLPGFVKVRA